MAFMSVLGRVERVPCRAQCSPLVVSKEMKTLYQPTEDVLLSVLSGATAVQGPANKDFSTYPRTLSLPATTSDVENSRSGLTTSRLEQDSSLTD